MVKKVVYLVAFILIFISSFSLAQKKIESVVKLSEGINSEAEEILPLLSQSGDSLFFARVFHQDNKGGKYSGSDIWISEFDESTQSWGKATNQWNDWNDKRSNFIVGINPEEQVIYQNNARNPNKGIKFVKKLNSHWTKLENISLPGIPKTGYQGIYINPDYTVILISMRTKNSHGKDDLYVSTRGSAGDWSKPVNLGPTINTSESEISPFLSADKKTLFFASNGHDGYGNMDIFRASRLYENWTVWSKPVNMGDQINSNVFDGYYSEYGDSIAFFSSNREGELADIYEVVYREVEVKKARTMPVVDASAISRRNYLNEDEIKRIFGFSTLQSIDIKPNSSITENNVVREIIYFLANKFTKNPTVKLGIKVQAHQQIGIEKMVKEASDIALFIATELNKNGIPSSRIQYEGVGIGNQNSSQEVAYRVSFTLFR